MAQSQQDKIKVGENYISILDRNGDITEIQEQYFTGIDQVESLNIYAPNLKCIPESLNRILVTKSAEIGKSKLKHLPAGVLQGSVERLKISNGQLRIDQSFSQLKHLKSLALYGFYGKKWPVVLSTIPQLESLELTEPIGKKLSHDILIEEIANITQLKNLELRFSLNLNIIGDSLRKMNFLNHFKFYFYHQGDGWVNLALLDEVKLGHFENHEEYQSFVRGKKFSNEILKEIYAVYSKKLGYLSSKNPNLLIEKEKEGLISTLNFTYRPSNQIKSQCKEFLSHLDFSAKNDPRQATHILSAKSELKDVIHLFENNLLWSTEDHLKKLIEFKTNPWLLEENSDDAQEQLFNLLASNQTENLLLAMEIMEGGGATEDLISMLAVLMMAHPDKGVQKSSEKLFKKIGPSSTYEYLKSSKISLRRSGNTLAKLNNLFNQDIGLNEITFRIYHGLIAGDNPTVKDTHSSILTFKDYTFKKPINEIIKHFNQIKTLSLENAKNFDAPTSLKNITLLDNLKILNLSKTKIILDKNARFPKSLSELNLSSCTIEDVSILTNLSELTELNVTGTHIKNWSFLESFSNLKTLVAARNKIKEITEPIIKHSSIRSLDLSYNSLTTADVLFPNYYTYLNLNNNKLEGLSAQVTNIAGLESLHLRANGLNSSFVRNIPVDQSNYISELDLSNNDIDQFKLETGQLSTLRNLDISKNKLSELDPSVFLYTQVSTLNISHNEIREIPWQITMRSPFRRLNFSHNKIEKLEAFINDLKVGNFSLNHNEISAVSPAIVRIAGDYSRIYWNMHSNPVSHRF